jgi:S1-C subfamily serine protease
MKHIISTCLFFVIAFASYSQDFVSELEFSRTFNIRKDSSIGTCFLINEKQKNYWITAKHVLGTVRNNQRISFFILQDTSWLITTGSVLIHSNPIIDIAVIVPDDTSSVNAISLNQTEIVLGDEGFFLGFPFGMKTSDNSKINKGFPFALIKKCVFSGNYTGQGVQLFFLDGNNNPGFSGGPVFFKNRQNASDRKLYLTAIVSAYVNQKNQMITPLGNFDYNENSGIILAYSSSHIKEILNQNGK